MSLSLHTGELIKMRRVKFWVLTHDSVATEYWNTVDEYSAVCTTIITVINRKVVHLFSQLSWINSVIQHKYNYYYDQHNSQDNSKCIHHFDNLDFLLVFLHFAKSFKFHCFEHPFQVMTATHRVHNSMYDTEDDLPAYLFVILKICNTGDYYKI